MDRTVEFSIAAPLRAAITHGNQALITFASAYMNARFAQSHGLLPAEIAWLLAVGYEWTYLRGLASGSAHSTRWSSALNWVAFSTAVIGGLLYALGIYHVIPDQPTGWTAAFLSLAHVLPMALLSLCSASVHRAKTLAERSREDRLQQARDDQQLEEEKKRRDLALWVEGQQAKSMLKNAENAGKMPGMAVDQGKKKCRHCGILVAYGSPAEAGVIARWGCPDCRTARKATQ